MGGVKLPNPALLLKRAPPGATDAELNEHRWQALMDLACEDIDAAVRVIDEHWKLNQATPLFWTMYLNETPDLAYQLALKLKPHRSAFAIDMLAASVRYASPQLDKLDHPSAALEAVVRSSCELLAEWTLDDRQPDPHGALLGIACLLQFGYPDAAYWRRIPEQCLATIKHLTPMDQCRELKLLAQVAFYADSSSAAAKDALQLFGAVVARSLDATQGWTPELEKAVFWGVGMSLSILEDKYLAFRNRRVAANPTHSLLRILDERIDAFRQELLAREPSAALRHLVSLALKISNETLIRKQHRILREEFEARARNFPVDAGLALKELIQHVGFSQLHDEMYRKELCQTSFDALIPVLANISSADAAIARTGIGWSPRPPDM